MAIGRLACFGWWQSSSIYRKVQQKGFSMIFQIVYPWNCSKDAQGDFRCGVETNFQIPSCHHKLKGDKPLILKILKWRTEFFRLQKSMLNFQDILRRISQYPKTPQANTFSRKFSHVTLERRHPHRCHAIQGPRPFRPERKHGSWVEDPRPSAQPIFNSTIFVGHQNSPWFLLNEKSKD